MRLFRLPALLLSLLLQIAPVLRVASIDAAQVLTPLMAVMRLWVGATAMAGSFHAVSGASPVLSSSKTKIGAIGANLNYRILLSGGTPEAYEAVPLAPGLALSLVTDSRGRVTGAEIKGLPTETGETVTTISAWDNPDFTGDTTSGEVTFLITDLEPLAPSVPAGGPVTFRAIGPATSTVTYRWSHNDIEITDGTNSSLTLPSVVDSDAGQYRVRIGFGGATVFTQRATLTVTPPSTQPTITLTTTDVKLHQGEPLLLIAEATGVGELTFAWTKDGDPVLSESSLHLQRAFVTPDDAGTYRVTVTSSGGSATSPPALVSIAGPLVIGAVSFVEGNFLVPFNGIAGRLYLLERQEELGALEWESAAGPLSGESGTFTVSGADSDTRVFRVRAN